MSSISLRLAAPILCLTLLFSAVSVRAQDSVPPEAYARINASLVGNHVLPRYRRLADMTAAFADATDAFCTDPAAADMETLRAGYHDAMDAWMGVQHLRFGPVELLMRGYRFYFWPEARGKVGDAVVDLLAAGDIDALAPARFGKISVAAQGLPAVEYLLYRPAPTGASETDRCALLTAIAGNMHAMASGIVADWQGGAIAFERTVIEPATDSAYFETHQDATLAFFKSFHAGLQLIADVKLKPVVGGSIDAVRPRAAESRLSDRALRNIIANLEALQALYLGESGPGFSDLVVAHGADAKLDPLMRKAFDMTIATARSIDRPLAMAVQDRALRPKAEKLKTQVAALQQIVRTRVAAALGLAVGFNSLDGD